MKFRNRFIVKPGRKVRLDDFDPEDTLGFDDKLAAREGLERNVKRLADLQYRLFAEGRRSLLVVFQAMDAGGKDGAIRRVMSGLNPQSCRVTSFKKPSDEELSHDFLWRIHHAVPARGEIGIFNRSHYEDVLVVRVHDIVPPGVWGERYDDINRFEKILVRNNVIILKFFLHISKSEQKKRLMARMDDPDRNWKITPEDFEERKFWDDYVGAYEDAIRRCSTPHAPWFIIPANHKWFRDLAISNILVETLEGLDMKFPPPKFDLSKIKVT